MKTKIYIFLEVLIFVLLIVNIIRYFHNNTDAGIAFTIAFGINAWRVWDKFEPIFKKQGVGL